MSIGYKVLAACAPGYYETGDAGVLIGYKVLAACAGSRNHYAVVLVLIGYKVLAACALICAFKRLLCRAALFLWMMPLSAMRSMTGTAFL